jgi:DNA-binding XRE family transcriptional regulator
MPNQYSNKQIEWVTNEKGCHLVTSHKPNKDGYIRKRINGKLVMLHRHVWELKNNAIPKGMEILHSCDNPSCINIDHLSLGTHGDNIRDMFKKGRDNVKNTKNRIHHNNIKEIRLLNGIGQTELAKLVNIDRTYLYKLENYKTSGTIQTMQKIAEVLSVSLDELLK